MPQRSGTAAAAAEAGCGVAQVKAAGQELAGGVVPTPLDIEIRPGSLRGGSDLVGDPVRVPRPGVGRVVGEQVRIIAQLDADRGEGAPGLVEVAHDQRAGFRVDASQRSWWVLVSLRTR